MLLYTLSTARQYEGWQIRARTAIINKPSVTIDVGQLVRSDNGVKAKNH